LEGQVHELAIKLDDAEAAALKGSRKALSALQSQLSRLESDYEAEVKHHADTVKNYRKAERKMKELTFQTDEDAKNNSRMQELVSKLQGKLKQYKLNCEEAEAQANDNLQKFRKANNELAAAEERADAAESALNKMRQQARSSTGSSGSRGGSYSISRKSVFTK
jgi:chromosome segregation ATPase